MTFIPFRVAAGQRDLERISYGLRGAPISPEAIHRDSESETIEVPTRQPLGIAGRVIQSGRVRSLVEYPVFDWIVRVRSVIRFELEDHADVGEYRLDSIDWWAESKVLEMFCTPGLDVRASCRSLHVELLRSSSPVDYETRRRWFVPESDLLEPKQFDTDRGS